MTASERARRPTLGRQWKLEDAKSRFSEVVRLARSEGPQHVSVRGEPAAVLISAEDWARLDRAEPELPLVDFLKTLHLDQLDVDRNPDTGRDLEL